METLILVIHISVCFFLIMVVLLQTGKGSDISAAFGGGGSQSVFGARGATTFLAKLTTGAAAIFMITAIALAYFSTKKQEASLFSSEKKQELPINKESENMQENKEEIPQSEKANNTPDEQSPLEEEETLPQNPEPSN